MTLELVRVVCRRVVLVRSFGEEEDVHATQRLSTPHFDHELYFLTTFPSGKRVARSALDWLTRWPPQAMRRFNCQEWPSCH